MIGLVGLESSRAKHEEPKKAALRIVGMHCASCAQTIEKALVKAKGVDKASVNFATQTAYVEYDEGATSEEELAKVVKGTGYDVAEGPQKIILGIGGMTCASCAQTIENALRETRGVLEANVNLATEKATIVYDPERTGYEEIKKAIEDTGYQVLARERIGGHRLKKKRQENSKNSQQRRDEPSPHGP